MFNTKTIAKLVTINRNMRFTVDTNVEQVPPSMGVVDCDSSLKFSSF